jgi:hypothetical protein
MSFFAEIDTLKPSRVTPTGTEVILIPKSARVMYGTGTSWQIVLAISLHPDPYPIVLNVPVLLEWLT